MIGKNFAATVVIAGKAFLREAAAEITGNVAETGIIVITGIKTATATVITGITTTAIGIKISKSGLNNIIS